MSLQREIAIDWEKCESSRKFVSKLIKIEAGCYDILSHLEDPFLYIAVKKRYC